MTVDGVRSLVDRVQAAINAHDLEAFLACFDETYDSEQPLRPEHSFRGREGVRRNWSANLACVPDLRWDLLDACLCARRESPARELIEVAAHPARDGIALDALDRVGRSRRRCSAPRQTPAAPPTAASAGRAEGLFSSRSI